MGRVSCRTHRSRRNNRTSPDQEHCRLLHLFGLDFGGTIQPSTLAFSSTTTIRDTIYLFTSLHGFHFFWISLGFIVYSLSCSFQAFCYFLFFRQSDMSEFCTFYTLAPTYVITGEGMIRRCHASSSDLSLLTVVPAIQTPQLPTHNISFQLSTVSNPQSYFWSMAVPSGTGQRLACTIFIDRIPQISALYDLGHIKQTLDGWNPLGKSATPIFAPQYSRVSASSFPSRRFLQHRISPVFNFLFFPSGTICLGLATTPSDRSTVLAG